MLVIIFRIKALIKNSNLSLLMVVVMMDLHADIMKLSPVISDMFCIYN